MSLSDDARTAIANVTADPDDFTAGGRTIALACADEILAVVMPDGRTIAQHLDDGAVALRLVDGIQEERFATTYDPETGATVWEADISDGNPAGEEWVPLADVDPEAADLLARLEADR